MSNEENALASFLAERLRESSGAIATEWVECNRSPLGDPAVEALSFRAVLDHIPPVILCLGSYVSDPTVAVRQEMLGHLRMHGQIRRDQGYDLRDLIAELDGLSHLIMRRTQSELAACGDSYPPEAALAVFGRLSDSLRALAFVSLGAYRDTEIDRRQALAGRMAELGRTIGHELRSPLNTIALSAAVLESPEFCADDELRRQQLGIIRGSVKHAESLLYDIDLLAMVESAYTGARMTPLPVVLEAVRQQLTARAKSLGVTLDVEPVSPRLAVETVVAQLVLTNLVGNAIKYSDPEKPARWVKIRAEEAPAHDSMFVVVEVTDNGVGIPPDLQGQVFQRHFSGHFDKGAGLGLAITHELIVERGGTIELESEDGQGTTVRIKLRAIDVACIEAYTRAADAGE